MKSKILGLFRSTQDIVSGETLSAALGISRVSVWKHIQKLQECGYQIEATPKGYQLLMSPDTPFPWEFPQRQGMIHYFPEVSSTMDIAREMARKGHSHFSVVIAGRHTSGRGRLRRTWYWESLVDDDGIVCIPPVRGEQCAADRLINLLTTASSGPFFPCPM